MSQLAISPHPLLPTPTPALSRPAHPLNPVATPPAGDDALLEAHVDADSVLGSVEPERRMSYYVQAADEMIGRVVEKESYLFSEDELGALARFTGLGYEGRCLFMRLYLRKHRWLRVDQFKYERDITNLEGAVRELCTKEGEDEFAAGGNVPRAETDAHQEGALVEVESTSRAEIEVLELSSDEEQPQQIDLTLSDSDEDQPAPQLSLKRLPTPPPPIVQEPAGPDYSVLAHDTSWLSGADAEQLFKLLSLEELATLAKKMKADPGRGKTTRQDWTAALLRTSTQSILLFAPSPKLPTASSSKLKGKGMAQPAPRAVFGLAKGTHQNTVVAKHALALIGNVIRLSPDWILLLNRVSLVYHRTAYDATNRASALTASLLARFGKRNYPDYAVSRSFVIFSSREVLVEFEDALRLERELDEILDETWAVAVPSSRTAKSGPNSKAKFSTEQERKRDLESIRIPKWREGVALMEAVWDRWLGICDERQIKAEPGGDEGELVYFRSRFHPGWPITRIVYKASALYARLNEHDREIDILRALLAQTAFHRGKRGMWYDRLALVIGHYPNKQERDTADPQLQEQLKLIRLEDALDVCFRGLKDPLTHLVYRSALERRVKRLESLLKRPVTERTMFPGLEKAEERVIVGERLDAEMDRRVMGRHSVWRGEKVVKAEAEAEDANESAEAAAVAVTAAKAQPNGVQATFDADNTGDLQYPDVKNEEKPFESLERDPNDDDDDDDAELGPEVRVEQVALEAYAKEGWKGYHSEGGIITTIWGLLMWDILFAPIDGAFETAYQSEPLDLRTDAFAEVRRELIDERLKEIERGRAVEILTAVDERERSKGTFCVGVRWDSYPLDDIVEIVQCLGISALVIICRMMCEEYGHRTSGLPDLCLWNPATRQILFSEVKGPGDALSESQRVWIDVFLSSGVPVEVAKVVTQEGYERMMEVQQGKKRKGKGGKGGGGGKGKKRKKEESEAEDEAEAEDESDVEAL